MAGARNPSVGGSRWSTRALPTRRCSSTTPVAGGRPSWYSGDTPQVRWSDGSRQKESLDVVKALDAAFPDTPPLWPPAGADATAVGAAVSAFRATFPRNARPSSRAAFLFEWDGDPLPRSTFERTLVATEVQRCGYTGATLWDLL